MGIRNALSNLNLELVVAVTELETDLTATQLYLSNKQVLLFLTACEQLLSENGLFAI